MKVLATDGLERGALELLQQNGFEVDVQASCAPDELAKIIGQYDAVIIRTNTKITSEILANKGELKVICSQTSGFDGIDIEAAKEKGIVVMNVPGCNANGVAELTIGHMINLARRMPKAHLSLKRMHWAKQRLQYDGTELAGKTLGIVGLGHVGRLLAKKASGMDMKVIAADPFVSQDAAREIGAELVSLETLLQSADFISVHAPLNNSTARMFGRKEFDLMKEGAFFISIARGGLIDEAELMRVLSAGKIRAALDVFQDEPRSDGKYVSANKYLIGLAESLTPHLGGSTKEARINASMGAAQQIIDGLAYGVWRNAINLPPSDAALKPYMDLAEKLGQFAAKLWFVGEPKRFFDIKIEYFGKLAALDTRIVTQAAEQGLISAFASSGPVGLVNAPVEAERRGFKITEFSRQDPINYSNLIAIEISGKNGEWHRLEGALTDGAKMQIVSIDDYRIAIEPSPVMFVFINEDTPAVIFEISGIIAKDFGINIGEFKLARNNRGTALGTVALDSEPPRDEFMAKIKEKMGSKIKFAKLLVF